MRHPLRNFCIALISSYLLPACVSIKPYERIYVNDPEMQMGSDAGKHFDNYVHSIRSGSIPAGVNKASGGCGCN